MIECKNVHTQARAATYKLDIEDGAKVAIFRPREAQNFSLFFCKHTRRLFDYFFDSQLAPIPTEKMEVETRRPFFPSLRKQFTP